MVARFVGWIVVGSLVVMGCGVDPAGSGLASRPAPATPEVTPLPAGVTAEIQLVPGGAPFGIVSDGKQLWVGVHRASLLYRIDPGTNQVARSLDLGQVSSCAMPSVGFGRIWIPPCEGGLEAVVVDTSSDAITGSINAQSAVALSTDAVWASADVNGQRRVLTYDPRTLQVVGPTTAIGPYDSYVNAPGAVWGISSPTGSISRLDPTTHALVERLTIPGSDPDEALHAAVLDGAIWIKGYESGALVRMDLTTHRFSIYQVPGYAQTDGYYDLALTAALGSLWFRISDTTVVRFDPTLGKVTATYPAGRGGGAVAVDFGSLWVANFDLDSVWREPIQK